MTKIAGSGYISQRHGSADPYPHQNVMDPEQCLLATYSSIFVLYKIQVILAGGDCPAYKGGGRKCRGKLKDFVLDWEAALPEEDLEISDAQSKMADLRYIDTISAPPMTVSFQLKPF
jgi:hypothetical protein